MADRLSLVKAREIVAAAFVPDSEGYGPVLTRESLAASLADAIEASMKEAFAAGWSAHEMTAGYFETCEEAFETFQRERAADGRKP